MESNDKLSLFSEETLSSLEMLELTGGVVSNNPACGANVGYCPSYTNCPDDCDTFAGNCVAGCGGVSKAIEYCSTPLPPPPTEFA